MAIKRRIDELVEAGHVEVLDTKRGHRATYSLTSPVFDPQQQAATPAPAPKPKAQPRTLAACRTCGRLTVKLSLDALCRPCVRAAELQRQVREARAHLGPDATAEQIQAHLQAAGATGEIRRALRAIREVA